MVGTRTQMVTDLKELRSQALEYIAETGGAWKRTRWMGGDSPQTANFWYVEGRPELSYWPAPLKAPK